MNQESIQIKEILTNKEVAETAILTNLDSQTSAFATKQDANIDNIFDNLITLKALNSTWVQLRNSNNEISNISFGDYIFNIPKLELKKNQEIIYLTEGENNLLTKLVEKKNDIVLREELAEKKYDETELRKVDVQITRLRQKIEVNPKQPQFIKTIRSKGYKLICNEI